MKATALVLVFGFLIVGLAQSNFDAIGDFRFSRSGESLVFSSGDTVFIRSLTSNSTDPLGKVTYYRLAHKKNAVVMVLGQAVKIVDLASRRVLREFELPEQVVGIFLVNTIATEIVFQGRESRNLYLVKIISEGILSQKILKNQSFENAWLSPTGKWLAIKQGQKVCIFDTHSQNQITNAIATKNQMGGVNDINFPSATNEYNAWQLEFAPDENSLVVLWGASIPKYWDAQLEHWTVSGQKLGQYPNSKIRRLTGFSSDGTQISGVGSQLFRVWDTKMHKIKITFPVMGQGIIQNVALKSNMQAMAVQQEVNGTLDALLSISIYSIPKFRLISRF